jgi:RNA polymerase sigma factor (TIGR02999 family)
MASETAPAERSVTELLHAWSAGDLDAAEAWVPALYDELRRLAAAQLRGEREEHTLEPTALVHEAYLRLAELRAIDWRSRSHFCAMAGRMMRRVLVDHARSLARDKRGGGQVRVLLEEAGLAAPARELDLIALDDALERLAAFDREAISVVELHTFGGLTLEETAAALDLSSATVVRRFRAAKAWLYLELKPAGSAEAAPGR